MASNTDELGLYKKDPVTDGGDNFNVETMLNENWDKLDQDAAVNKAHRGNKSNPHGTTASQVGAYTKAQADTMADGKASAAQENAINFAKAFGLGADPMNIADANNIGDGTGFYNTDGNTLNAPDTAGGGLIHIARDARPTQLYINYQTARTYVRSYVNSTLGWTDWKEVETTEGAQDKADDAEAAAIAGAKSFTEGFAQNAVATSSSGDPNTTKDAYMLTNHANSPGGGVFWHIQTYFYNGKTSANNRAQVAVAYNGDTPRMYIRHKYGESWEPWLEIENKVAAQAKADAAKAAAIAWANSWGLGSEARDITAEDLNDHIQSGFYVGQNMTNAPNGNWFYVIAIKLNGNAVAQIAVEHSTSARMFIRRKATGTWESWKEQETTEGAQGRVDAHANQKDNPHKVTSGQVTYLGGSSYTADVPGSDYPTGVTTFSFGSDSTWPWNYGTVLNIKNSDIRFTQLLYPHGGGGAADGPYVRLWYSGAWTEFVKIETAAGAQAKVDAHEAKSNPHGITPGTIGALSKQGGAMEGSIQFKPPAGGGSTYMTLGSAGNIDSFGYASFDQGVKSKTYDTEAIVEKGKNANGEYIRYDSGVQICWNDIHGSNFTDLTPTGAIYRTETLLWTFPAAFNSSYHTHVSAACSSWLRWADATNIASSTGVSLVQFSTIDGSAYSVQVMATGRWK